SPDFIRGVAIGSNAIRTRYNGSDLTDLQKMADHVVGDQRQRNAAAMQLPSRQARALQIRARLRDQYVEALALLDGNANHAEGCTDAGGGERTSIAFGPHTALAGHELGTEAANGLVDGFLFKVNLLSLVDQAPLDFVQVWCGGEVVEADPHAFECPE